VIDLVARGDMGDVKGRVLAKMDLQALRAMRGLIDGVLAGRDEEGQAGEGLKRKWEGEEGGEEDEKVEVEGGEKTEVAEGEKTEVAEGENTEVAEVEK
jgi:hypothetical protein